MTKASAIQMVDLKSQYKRLKREIDLAITDCIEDTSFIGGPIVQGFTNHLADYLKCDHAIGCGNGTDALQIALMALDLKEGDEVIVPAFTYVATAEVIALLKLKPVMIDVDPDTFNITADLVKPAITQRTKAIIPVHLFGQSTDMEPIMELADQHGMYVVEDNAQSIGADYQFSDGQEKKTGTIGHIGCTSFYPSKNLGAYGDGGAIFTNKKQLAQRIKMIANHGQVKRYYHDIVGCNSRLDAIQAAILNVKLKYLDQFNNTRAKAAGQYDRLLRKIPQLKIPVRQPNSTHVFHQYTIQVADKRRDQLQEYLKERGIPSMIYYPVPLYRQKAYQNYKQEALLVTEQLCNSVLSLPMHSEIEGDTISNIAENIRCFFD